VKLDELTNNKIFIVAEVGNNHEGDINCAKKLIEAAAKCGADAVKFQTFLPEYYVSQDDKSRFERLKKFQLTFAQFEDLANFSKECGIDFFSTPFDMDSAIFLNKIQQIFKISSGDNNFWPLIDLVLSFKKTIIISTGMANTQAIRKIYERYKQYGSGQKLVLMHCVSAYPVSEEHANIGAISNLRNEFPDVLIGYSDHTIGTEAALYAAAAGARVIEKHFTLSKNYSDFRDHQLSADPKDMLKLVAGVRAIELLKGSGIKEISDCEKSNSIQMRRSIVANRDIDIGEIISIEDITWIRPGGGIDPGDEEKVLNKTAIKKIKRFEKITLDMLG
jgi:sialic acid synthase SpsE